MSKKHWLLLFITALSANLIGDILPHELIVYVSKPVIVMALAGYFIISAGGFKKGLQKWILLALIFSWLGDILLLFVRRDELFFLLGLSAFLAAHIFYIIFFHQLRIREKIRSNVWLLFIVIAYYLVLLSFLSPHLGDMKIPVRVYGIVISFMLMLALHMRALQNRRAGLYMLAGAVLFVISDSILAVNKFFNSFQLAGFLIMLTYGLAQFFIVQGAVRYINSGSKR